jgi:DNA-nicking Smr family endonuclease
MARRRRGAARTPRFDSGDPLLDAQVVAELDLHRMTSTEATAAARAFLEGRHRGGQSGVVRIITGRGRGSAGPPVLRGAVKRLLVGPLRTIVADYALDDSGGAFLVRVR